MCCRLARRSTPPPSSHDALRVAERLEAELGPEQRGFVEGCPADWEEMPTPEPPVTVGIDGGYVRSWMDRPANFEVIVGKSVIEPDEDGTAEPARRFGFVVGHDAKPRRRLHELLRKQGVGMNREVTFMSDGGKGVRDLQWAMRPNAEQVLDTFHIAMRVTVMQQIARGLPPPHDEARARIIARLERVRRFLWHGPRAPRARGGERRRGGRARHRRAGGTARTRRDRTRRAASGAQASAARARVRRHHHRQRPHDPELRRAAAQQ